MNYLYIKNERKKAEAFWCHNFLMEYTKIWSPLSTVSCFGYTQCFIHIIFWVPHIQYKFARDLTKI